MMPATASVPALTMPNAAPPKPAPTAATGFSPLFSEGQQVLILADPDKPTGPVSLMADASSNRPGPTVAPNATATVQDGELRNNGWIYSIRTAQGATGWVSEKQLRAK
ncbi:MAG: SH3 domain-containing protein, partial [Nitrospirota bacterium]|nr:SH3 domain-containing protein [Nitrospirota bacterium]